jgi:hypothetical protein
MLVQSDFRYFYRQKRHVYKQVVNMEVAHVHGFSSAAEKTRPKGKVSLYILVTIKLDATSRLG